MGKVTAYIIIATDNKQGGRFPYFTTNEQVCLSKEIADTELNRLASQRPNLSWHIEEWPSLTPAKKKR
jgi:hypothetical protein